MGIWVEFVRAVACFVLDMVEKGFVLGIFILQIVVIVLAFLGLLIN